MVHSFRINIKPFTHYPWNKLPDILRATNQSSLPRLKPLSQPKNFTPTLFFLSTLRGDE